MDMLKSEVLTESLGRETILKYFPVDRLSKDPARRFAELFVKRPRWQVKDLQPYLAGLKVG